MFAGLCFGINLRCIWQVRVMRLKGLETCDHVLCLKHVPSHEFLLLLATANCFIGNSSAGIREAGAFGTPGINIGNRQVLMQFPPRSHPCLVHGPVRDSRSLWCRKLLKSCFHALFITIALSPCRCRSITLCLSIALPLSLYRSLSFSLYSR